MCGVKKITSKKTGKDFYLYHTDDGENVCDFISSNLYSVEQLEGSSLCSLGYDKVIKIGEDLIKLSHYTNLAEYNKIF